MSWLGVECGYAGGLGPDNVVEQVQKISQHVDPSASIWIDMERRVRSDDDKWLDLGKVRTVLAKMATYMGVEV